MPTTIDAERLKKIEGISLSAGSHSPDSQFCVMEAVAFVAGENWNDCPKCACPVISSFLRAWNDSLPTDAERDRLLKPLIPILVGTRNKAREKERALMAADWLIRVYTPAWLRLAGLTTQAASLANRRAITSMKQVLSNESLEAVCKDATAASAAAWTAASAAAWAAASAAASAAAWDAARAAAWDAANKKLDPTVKELQQSALALVHRMIEA